MERKRRRLGGRATRGTGRRGGWTGTGFGDDRGTGSRLRTLGARREDPVPVESGGRGPDEEPGPTDPPVVTIVSGRCHLRQKDASAAVVVTAPGDTSRDLQDAEGLVTRSRHVRDAERRAGPAIRGPAAPPSTLHPCRPLRPRSKGVSDDRRDPRLEVGGEMLRG